MAVRAFKVLETLIFSNQIFYIYYEIFKKQISENNGYMAYFIDSEGNRIALHSLQ